MAEYRDPTLAPGATSTRTTATNPNTTTSKTGTTATTTKSGMSRWIWIIAAAIVAIVVLMMLFGGADETVEAPAGGDAVVTEPATPGVDPVEPAPAPAD